MTASRICAKCGATLSAESALDVCPRCVAAQVLSPQMVPDATDATERPAGTIALEFGSLEQPGDRIGRYMLFQKIGEGGCGVVYMAEQEEPVRRRVALKVIKLGMDTKSVIARFEAERQALAMMDHPNIAKVLDAGATDQGRPYFVMELVRGIKITDYCDQNNLPTAARLDLFTKVCSAIQHAHQKGIIHRDIKPSNILVTLHDGVPVPKVIDFGIAKATTDQRLTDKTLFTAFEQFIGTPAYMSPEQAEMSGLDIDTRTDIYALGVLLFYLLTGKTPFDPRELMAAGIDEMRRTIREKEPVRPSTRLSTMLAGELTATAQHRHTEAPRLVHLLRGDLDWIVMKALEKDRTRRYETANGLAMDLKRHLDNEPVVARPPSAIYKLRKAIRRNKTAFAAGTVVLAALAAGFAVAVGQYAAKNRAYKRERAEAEKARHEAAKSEQVVKFLEDMLGTTSPLVVPGVNASIVRQTLDWASERIRKELKNQPAVEAQLRMVLGKAYKQIHEDQKAEAMLRESLAIHRRLHGDRHPELVAPLLELSGVLWTTRRNAEAERLIREALALHHEFSKEKEPQLDEILNLLGVVLASQDKLAAAEQVLGETLALKRKLYGPTNSTVAVALINLGDVFKRQEKLPQAAAAEREALEMVTAALAALPETTNPGELLRLQAAAANNLSNTLEKQGLRSEAEAPRRQALEASKKLYGVGSQEAIGATRDLMNTLIRQRKLEEADRLTTAAAKELEAAELSLRASGAALRGRWKEAAAGYARLVELEPDNHEHYHALAPLLAQTGDWEGYRKNCQNEVARFRDTQIPHVAERMAKDCLILPNSGVDLKVVTAWTDLAVTAGKDSGVLPWFQHAKGLAEYRQGRFAEAIEWAQKALSRSQANRDLQATAVLAMSQHRLGHTDAARLSLAKAAELEANSPSLERGDIGNGWLDWIIAHALFREAQALIEDIPHSNGAAQKTNPALEEAHP